MHQLRMQLNLFEICADAVFAPSTLPRAGLIARFKPDEQPEPEEQKAPAITKGVYYHQPFHTLLAIVQ
jgi:hypothetical protein